MFRAAFVILSLVANAAAVEIIAHRGASADAPENTLSAMKLAWEQGADAIELDLWLSKDDRLIVFHDADTKRFEKTPRKVSSLTLKEMQQLDVGAWKDPKYTGERVPRLQPILKTIPKGRRAVLEIKCGPEILPQLKRVLDRSGLGSNELAVITFNYETLKESKKVFPHLEHFYLYGYKKDPKTQQFPELGPVLEQCKTARADGLDLHYDWPITPEFVKKLKAEGLKLIVWTVNDAAVARRMVAAGVDGITTDKPQWLREQLASQQ